MKYCYISIIGLLLTANSSNATQITKNHHKAELGLAQIAIKKNEELLS